MANVKKQKGILLLDREKLDIFAPSHTAILSLPIPPTAIKNMDVINKDALVTAVHTFIESNKLAPTAFSIIIHERILFQKLFPAVGKKTPPVHSVSGAEQPTPPQVKPVTPPSTPTGTQMAPQPVEKPFAPAAEVSTLKPTLSSEEQEKEVQQFIESVPFDEIMSKEIKTPDGTSVVVTNKTSVATIKDCFENEGFSIESVIPATVLPKDVNLANGLTLEVAQLLLARVDALKSQNMLHEEPVETQPAKNVSLGMPQKESDKKRLILMAGVFIVLIIIMIVFYLRMNAENAKLTAKPAPTAVPAAVVISPTPEAAASTSAEFKQTLPIQLSANARNASFSALLTTRLQQVGYSNTTRRTLGTVSPQTLLMLPENLPQDVKDELTELVSGVDPNVAVRFSTAEESQVFVTF